MECARMHIHCIRYRKISGILFKDFFLFNLLKICHMALTTNQLLQIMAVFFPSRNQKLLIVVHASIVHNFEFTRRVFTPNHEI